MSNIERFNILLNTTQDDRYNRWVEFRTEIDSSLLREINGLDSKELAIVIGAGRCEDFSIKLLLKHFKTVVLSDIDIESIFNAYEYKTLSDEEKKRIEVIKVEYTGLDNNGFFVNLEDKLRSCKDFDAIDRLLKTGFDGIESYSFLKKYRADLVYVSPIYTQLIYQQVMMVGAKLKTEGYQANLLQYLEHELGNYIIKVLTRFNENLKRLTKDTLIIASDIFQDYSNSDFIKRIKKNPSNEAIDKVYDKYFEDYGFGMGDLGLYLLNDLMKLQSYEWLLWPFANDSEMVVKLGIYKNNL